MSQSADEDSVLRQAGRLLLISLYSAHRALRLYPVENAAVQRALNELQANALAILGTEGEIEIRLTGDVIFINRTRLRLGLDNFAAFSGFVSLMRGCGVGALLVSDGVTRREWQAWLSILTALPGDPDPVERLDLLLQRMTQAELTHLQVSGISDQVAGGDGEGGDEALERAKQTYAQGINVAREVVHGVRLGRTPNARRIKRAIQMIVDQVMENELSMTGLTTLREYDEYTFVHSVNVAIFAITLGKRLGFDRVQLYDLGLAALLHDIGKARIAVDVLHKDGMLEEGEWHILQAHPWLGTLTLFKMREGEDLPYRAILTAYEHHMKLDLTGYPRPIRPRRLGLYTRLISVADGYDAATSQRSYKDALTPDEVLREMWFNPNRGYDLVLVKALISLLGIYPVGTCVILDTFEVAVVAGLGAEPENFSRPVVRLVLDQYGARIPAPGTLVDLASTDGAGNYPRTIVKVTSADRYGIQISDYFV